MQVFGHPTFQGVFRSLARRVKHAELIESQATVNPYKTVKLQATEKK